MTSLTAIKDAAPRLTLGYGYPAGQNNGNLASQSIAGATGSWQQTYTYDSFNRLTHAAEAGSWSETSSYDRWGNRWVSASNFPLNLSTPTAATQFDTATNRLQQESNGQPLPPNAYDAQGNLTNHPWIGQMSYDGEGKIWRHIKGGTTVEFTYDGEGRRVKKRVGTAPPTIYVYDATGQLAADYGTADGTLNCGTCYITADHLGSTRLTTGATGDTAGRLDYFPFGETIPGGAGFGNRPSPTGPRQKFTGKERDTETGLDYFGARYFSGPQGRFTSPDAPFADQFPENPQSWNLYSYTRSNPLRFVDPTGMKAISAEACKKNPDCVSVPINVIYDQNAQIFDEDRNVLPAVQSKVDGQIAAAQHTYGNALVSFDITYSEGAIEGSGGNQTISGTQPGINVVVTDSRDSFVPGGAMEVEGRALIRLNAGTSVRSTLSHELGHVLAGDTRIPRIPILGQVVNTALDIRTDAARAFLPFFSPYHGNRFDPPPGQRLPVTNLFNQGAQRFRRR